MARIMINGIDTYYEEIGSGDEAFLYVQHGGQSKNELLSLLSPKYHIYCIHLPGYGKSTKLKEFRGFKQWSDDIYTFSRKLNLDKFIYVGFSLTGIVGFYLAQEHPELFKALITIVSIPVANVPPPHPEEQKALDSGTFEEHRAVTDKLFLFPAETSDKRRLLLREKARKQLPQDKETTDKESLAYRQDQILGSKEGRERFVPHLKEIKVPTLMLFGGRDYANPIDQVITSAMSIPGAKAVFFEDYGHGLSLEGPDKIANEIFLFVNELGDVPRKVRRD
jgi:pimeloyl-ACP methyl ester carboxylesterase